MKCYVHASRHLCDKDAAAGNFCKKRLMLRILFQAMSDECRYHKGMKRFHMRIPFYIAVWFIFFLCILDAGSEAADNSPIASDKMPPIMIEAVPDIRGEQTVRLLPFEQIPDSAEVRKSIINDWFSAPIEKVITMEAQTYTDSKGNIFTVSGKYADDKKGCYAISIVPKLTDYGIPDRKLVAQGTWIIYRNAETGIPSLIKIYPRENAALSIQLRPANGKAYSGKSFIDVCLFNAYVCKDIAVGIPFDMLYSVPLSHLKGLTEAIIPWSLFNPPHFYNAVEAMSKIIESRMYQLIYLEDGCFDHDGKPVHIGSLEPQTEFEINAALNIDQIRAEVVGGVNDAGFVKWIIDGIVRPVAGQGTIIESLKRTTDVPRTHFTKPVLHKQNIFFALDWIRNLGSAALSLNLKRTVYPAVSGLDVKICPFALTAAASPLCTKDTSTADVFSGYEQYAGYQTSYLLALFYYLTITEPGHFYLGCLSKTAETQAIRTYSDIAVFFPYFDLWGEFHLDVYKSGAQVPINEFIEKNKDTYTAIVRVRAPETGLFNP